MIKLIFLVLLLILVGYLYEKYKKNDKEDVLLKEYDLVKKYLLNDYNTNDYFKNNDKPILWIPLDYNINARNWQSFYSRNTYDLNQPYILLCIQTIINKCNDSFKIAIIDDNSYQKLISGCDGLNDIPEPVKSNARKEAQTKLLYYYGGMIVPPSFICMNDLIHLFNDNLLDKDMFVTNQKNSSVLYDNISLISNCSFMGAKKLNNITKEFILYLDGLMTNNNSDDIKFLGSINNWLHKKCNDNLINTVPAEKIGVIDSNKKLINIEELLDEGKIELDKNCNGILLPQNEILKRTKYGFFSRMSLEQILHSDIVACKHIIYNL